MYRDGRGTFGYRKLANGQLLTRGYGNGGQLKRTKLFPY